MPRTPLGADLVGKAWRCKDGLVRWVYAQTTSTRLLYCYWLDEATGVWHGGGTRDPRKWPKASDAPLTEYPAPAPGDTWVHCGVLGHHTIYRKTRDGSDYVGPAQAERGGAA